MRNVGSTSWLGDVHPALLKDNGGFDRPLSKSLEKAAQPQLTQDSLKLSVTKGEQVPANQVKFS